MKSLSLSWSLALKSLSLPGPWSKVLVKVLAVQFFKQNSALRPEFNPALQQQYPLLRSLLSKTFCTPASSAPVERVFSQSGLIGGLISGFICTSCSAVAQCYIGIPEQVGTEAEASQEACHWSISGEQTSESCNYHSHCGHLCPAPLNLVLVSRIMALYKFTYLLTYLLCVSFTSRNSRQ